MAEEVQRSRGRPTNYKLDRGGVPAEFGPFYGTVKNNVDPTRAGRLQVYIEAFADGNPNDSTKWTSVSYLPNFFGSTPANPAATGVGGYVDGNPNAYGMWFTPPDIGVTVLCVFVNGDRSQGFYIGVVPEQSLGHMVPAIGAAPQSQYVAENENQRVYTAGAPQLPVAEINVNNKAIEGSGRFFDKPKPIHGVVTQTMFYQGLLKDPERGPIGSSSQRESPSRVFGVSTPGMPVYQGGMKPADIQAKIDSGALKPQDAKVIGRTGGHSIVMDDGDIKGENRLMRFRTTAGHQITMSDSGNFLYIVHANGQAWIELGAEGTLDVYATNSINLRTKGDINFHADRDINMYAGRFFLAKAESNMHLEAMEDFKMNATGDFKIYSQSYVGVKSDGTIALDSSGGGSWNGGGSLTFSAGGIDLNGPAAAAVEPVNAITKTLMDDTTFSTAAGWTVEDNALESIVSRAPTHEPYPYHNKGVDVAVAMEQGTPPPPPGAIPVPAGVEITRTS